MIGSIFSHSNKRHPQVGGEQLTITLVALLRVIVIRGMETTLVSVAKGPPTKAVSTACTLQ